MRAHGIRKDSTDGQPERPRRRWARVARALALVLASLSLLVLAAGAALQAGLFDEVLTRRAQAVIGANLGTALVTELDGASVRFGADGRLAVEVSSLSLTSPDGEAAPVAIKDLRLLLQPLALIRGDFRVASLHADGIRLNLAAMGPGEGEPWSAVRIDTIGALSDRIFARLDGLIRLMRDGSLGSVVVSDWTISGLRTEAAVDRLEMRLEDRRTISLAGSLMVGGQSLSLEGRAPADADGKVQRVELALAGLNRMANGAFSRIPADAPHERAKLRFGLESDIGLELSLRRFAPEGLPRAKAVVTAAPGTLTMGGAESEFRSSRVTFAYLPEAQKIEILPSVINVAQTTIPFTGGIIDLSNLPGEEGRGFAIEAIVADGRADPVDSGEPPLPFAGKVFARFLKHENRLVFDEIALDTPAGNMFASAAMEFGETSPQISFAAEFARMRTAGLKQLWPHWIGQRPRAWVQQNLFGGTVENGSIRVFVPEGRMAEQPGRLELDEEQLLISFDFDNARLGVAGEIPPLRGTKGSFSLVGDRMDIEMAEATVYFPTDRQIRVTDGRFSVPHTHADPLMAELDLAIEGEADAAAELVSYHPIDVLSRSEFAAGDFSGTVVAKVAARFGLLADQQPPAPEWQVDMALEGVDVGKPVEGRKIAAVTGTLSVNPRYAVLDAAAEIDGAPLDLEITRPLQPDANVERQRLISGTLSDNQRAQLVPQLNGLVEGPVTLAMRLTEEGAYSVDIDLTDARLNVPGLGWSKPAGVRGEAGFVMSGEEGATHIDEFVIDGDGFGARGKLDLDSNGLVAASFADVQLSAGDDFFVEVNRSGTKALTVDVTGRSLDLRPLLSQLRSMGGGSGGKAAAKGDLDIELTATLDSVRGHNGEMLNGVSANYAGSGGTIRSIDLMGTTESGANVALAMAPVEGRQTLTLQSGDAGAVARFADLYGRLSGGGVAVELARDEGGPFVGTVRMNDFAIIDEDQLARLVSARAAGADASLNDMLQGRIDTTTARFERGFARVRLGDGFVTVADGVVRGPQIGLTFEGTVADPAGNMAITGTFMPAYGLNRLVAEIPLIGQLLGNGRDRGLIGITFRLAGDADNPELTVNPISAMAPGIFRQIFEF